MKNIPVKLTPMKLGIISIVTSLMFAAPVTTQAEILAIGPNAKVLTKANLPKLGQSMRHVKAKYGQPSNIKKSSGKVTKRNPKITRWDYRGFSVYFERKHVLHSVVRR